MLIAAAVLGDSACTQTQPLPALPKVDTSAFPERTRAEVNAALAQASAHPDDAPSLGRLAMVLHSYQQLDLAETLYRRAHLLDPKSLDWAYYLTVLEQIHGETRQAINDARAAVKIDSASQPARMRLAEALLQARQFGEARKIYEKLVDEESDLAMYQYGLGRSLEGQGQLSQAIEHYRKACELAPSFAGARYALAMAYRSANDLPAARQQLEIYKNTTAIAPPEDTLMARVTALNQGGLQRAQAAQQYIAQHRPLDAAKELETAVANDPNDEIAHTNLVAVYWELKQYDKAEQHYRIAAKLNPATGAHYIFGLVMLDQKRYPEAAAAFRRAIELNPRDNGANTQLGRVLEFQGDLQGAIRQYEKALETDPNSRATNYVLGEALLKSGQGPAAIEHLLKTIQPPADEKTPAYAREIAAAYHKLGNDERARYYLQIAGGGQIPSASGESLAGQSAGVLQGASAASAHP
ncbi:MAG TPA: tetratricopeptide repeat protein [Candidatus Binataceae bacterium]|nr:tetratricopeptide repeat protein [Candidatus Binataceae bacterium]